MKENFTDIKSRIPFPPDWYDQNGTPRYGDFHPDKCPDIYSNQVCLFRIACQACDKEFKVEMHTSIWDHRSEQPPKKWHYGDPPAHECIGDTMNCIDLEVLEVWQRYKDWKRRRKGLEGEIE